MNKIKNYRLKASAAKENVAAGMEKILKRKDLPTADKRSMCEDLQEKAQFAIFEILRDVSGEAKTIKENAEKKYHESRRVDNNLLSQRASMLAPLLNNIGDEALLNIYQNKHGDKVTRTLIAQIVDLRAASKTNPETDELSNKFKNLESKLYSSLPDDEKRAFEELQFAGQIENYAENVQKMLLIDAMTIERDIAGGELKLEQRVSYRMAAHAVSEFEGVYNG